MANEPENSVTTEPSGESYELPQGDHPLEVAACLNNLGEVARQRGNLEAAQAHHRASRRLREEIGNRIGVAYSDNNLGDVLTAQGDFDAAYQHYRQAVRLALEVDAVPAAVYILAGVARWHAQRRDWEHAAHLLGAVQTSADARDVKDRIEALLKTLSAHVAAPQLQAWLERGAARSLKDWAESL